MKTGDSLSGLASIIVPCWNLLECTRLCVAALGRHTPRPWELVVVDNGSTDGTAEYLAGVRDMASVPVPVITNATNRGFPAAINQGLEAARGEYLVLLNNDVVGADGWLGQLVGLVNARRRSPTGDTIRAPSVRDADGSVDAGLPASEIPRVSDERPARGEGQPHHDRKKRERSPGEVPRVGAGVGR